MKLPEINKGLIITTERGNFFAEFDGKTFNTPQKGKFPITDVSKWFYTDLDNLRKVIQQEDINQKQDEVIKAQNKKFYLITLDADDERLSYPSFERVIEEMGSAYQVFYENWIVCTIGKSAQELADIFRTKISAGDKIFITEINIENSAGWMPSSLWDWIKKFRDSAKSIKRPSTSKCGNKRKAQSPPRNLARG